MSLVIEDTPKKKKGLRLVSKKSTKKMLGRWKKLDSTDKSDTESANVTINNEAPSRVVIGANLDAAVFADPSMDGIPLPAFFRLAMDYVDTVGLNIVGIYRVSSNKARLDELERCVNEGRPLDFADDPVAASELLKRFLRKLPEPIIPPEFENIIGQCECGSATKKLTACMCPVANTARERLQKLSPTRLYLVGYVYLHAQRVINNAQNRMDFPAVATVLRMMRDDISPSVICYFLSNASSLLVPQAVVKTNWLFDFETIPYIPPKTSSEIEEWKCEDKQLIMEELQKQTNWLVHLHKTVSLTDANSDVNGDLWHAQMNITALKRRLKAVAEPTIPAGSRCNSEDRPCPEMFEEKQLMAIQSMLKEDIAAERQRIARLLWKMRALEAKSITMNLEKESDAKETEADRAAEESYREQCALEEAARSALIEELGRLRQDCAVLRSQIEMVSQSNIVSTRF